MLCIRPNKNEKMVRDQKFLKTLLGKLDRGEIRRDFWLQRKSTQWNNQIRDQAIVTTVQGEDIDPVKICEEIREGKPSQKWIVDGGNRFETWNNFYNNVFALGKNLENYIVPYEATKKDEKGNVVKDEDGYPIMEELEFDLRGKRYKDLPMELKERFNNYKVIYVEHSKAIYKRFSFPFESDMSSFEAKITAKYLLHKNAGIALDKYVKYLKNMVQTFLQEDAELEKAKQIRKNQKAKNRIRKERQKQRRQNRK